MKLKRCFIDDQGNVWKDSSLIEAAEDLPIELFIISTVSLDEIIRWQVLNLRDYVNHYRRVRDADLSIPIILNEKGYPMDGWHRIIKAVAQGDISLPSKRFNKDPEPDFRNEKNKPKHAI